MLLAGTEAGLGVGAWMRRNGHMLFLDGVFTEQADGCLRFHLTKAPTAAELNELAYTLVFRIGRHLEHQEMLERDAENSYPSAHGVF